MDLVPAVVCVDGMGTNALATVRALGRRGIPVNVAWVRGGSQVVSASRYCSASIEVPDSSGLCATLLRFAESLPRRPLLYIDNDAMIRLLAPDAAALGRRFELVEPLADAARLTDKAFQLEASAQAGIAVPRTWFPASWSELQDIGRHTRKRLLAKPSPGRLAPGEDAGFKVIICPSAQALAERLRARGVRPDAVLVQEYIEGDDAQIRVGLSYRCLDGRCYVLSAQKLRQTQPGAGVMAVGRALDDPQVRDLTRRLAHTLGVRGVLSTEFKLDPTDGKLYFIEWNPRPAYFQSLGWKSGFDLAALAYWDHVDPERLPDPGSVPRHTSRHYWINFRGDLQHLSIVPRLALAPSTWAPYFGDREWALFASDDLKPWGLAMARMGATLPRALVRHAALRLSARTQERIAH